MSKHNIRQQFRGVKRDSHYPNSVHFTGFGKSKVKFGRYMHIFSVILSERIDNQQSHPLRSMYRRITGVLRVQNSLCGSGNLPGRLYFSVEKSRSQGSGRQQNVFGRSKKRTNRDKRGK